MEEPHRSFSVKPAFHTVNQMTLGLYLNFSFLMIKNRDDSWAQWLTPVILAFGEAEIRRIVVQGQPQPKVQEIPSEPIKSCTLWCKFTIPDMRLLGSRPSLT
jgi:hypothetical protein